MDEARMKVWSDRLWICYKFPPVSSSSYLPHHLTMVVVGSQVLLLVFRHSWGAFGRFYRGWNSMSGKPNRLRDSQNNPLLLWLKIDLEIHHLIPLKHDKDELSMLKFLQGSKGEVRAREVCQTARRDGESFAGGIGFQHQMGLCKTQHGSCDQEF